jgi:ketosteroid isomerase-like protein
MIRVRAARIFSTTVFAMGTLMMIAPTLSHASPQDDAKAVAALDTEYQAAVKNNDAETMDRILADDFILVTGRGKVYNKADLLKSARDKDATYEHQEDTEQTVRVWGDTARHHRAVVGERHARRQAVRLQALVQRHLRAHVRRLALRVRPGLAAASQGAVISHDALLLARRRPPICRTRV